MRILIAEDDSALASFIKKGLDAEHYAVDVSADGEQARALAGEFDYDLVVLGSRGRSATRAGILGSVNGAVHFHTSVPMLSFPTEDEHPG